MADDAFALSPISARATMPTEADYDAICEAFMETSRGRWFLVEYAKRNRNADTRAVLDAVGRIETMLDERKAPASAPASAIDPAMLDALRDMLAQTQAQFTKALAAGDAVASEDANEAVKRAGQMVQGVAWTLREIGSDGRICTILDEQAQVIARHCDLFDTEPQRARDALAVFAAMRERFDAIAGYGPDPSHDTQAAQPAADMHADAPIAAHASAVAEPDVQIDAVPGQLADAPNGTPEPRAHAVEEADDIAHPTMFPFARDLLNASAPPGRDEPAPPPVAEFDDVEWTGDAFGIPQDDSRQASPEPETPQDIPPTAAGASAHATPVMPHDMPENEIIDVIELDDTPVIVMPPSPQVAQNVAPPRITLGDAILSTGMPSASSAAPLPEKDTMLAAGDPMAALRKMTPFEKIALFS